LLTLGGIAVLARRSLTHPSDPCDLLSLARLAGKTAFVLCVGSYWGFQQFPRFMIPALPGAWRGALPDRWYLGAPMFAGVYVMAVLGGERVPVSELEKFPCRPARPTS
jgi:hypothetical protein